MVVYLRMPGILVEEWYNTYPALFDEQDLIIARSQAKLGYHFFEWLAAIIIFQTYGLLSLIEQYEFKSHKRKQAILEKIINNDLLELVLNHRTNYRATQCPDLFVYSPDYSVWFFCEVKGPRDRLTNAQKKYFNELTKVANNPVRIIRFVPNKE